MNDIAISVKNLSKKYRLYESPQQRLKEVLHPFRKQYHKEFWALRDVSFEVKKGESIGIIGKNGSGKSTLLQILCGVLQKTKGEVLVNGKVSALLELGAGFNPELTGRENVYMNGAIMGFNKEAMEKRIHAIIEFADIGEFIDQPVKTYSSGMFVRLAFAVAINVDPDLLVIDEALAVGDAGFQARCFARIAELKKRGVTLLFVSHSPSLVTQLCDKAILLERGEILFSGASYNAIIAYNAITNAGDSDYAAVRNDLLSMAETVEYAGVYKMEGMGSIAGVADCTVPVQKSYFDKQVQKSVKPSPFIEMGGVITDFQITDISGRSVNVLTLHEKFILSYTVRFKDLFSHVRFAWLIKTTTGLIVGGGSSHMPCAGISINPSSEFKVRSFFLNLFTPGDYIIDIFVRGQIERDDEFIHGVSNAICFRSVSYNTRHRNGIVDCIVAPEFELIDTTNARC